MENQYHSREIQTIGAAFHAYSTALARLCAQGQGQRNVVSLARTAVLGYTVPAWGGPSRQGQRMLSKEIKAAQHFLDTLPLAQLNQALQVQASYFETHAIQRQIQKANRYQLSKFITWVQAQGWLTAEQLSPTDEATEPRPQAYCHSFNVAKAQGKQPLRELALTKRVRRPDFGLKPHEINATLQTQIQAIEQFEAQYLNHRPATITSNISFLMRMLGWQHRYGLVPLEELSLTGLVPYTSLRVSLEAIQAECPNEEEAWQKLLVRREHRKELAVQQARAAERVWDDYFIFYSDAPDTQVATLQALIILAKYFYRQETENTASKSGYTDIPVVLRLRQRLSAANQLRKAKPPEIAYKERSVSWETVFEVLDRQQQKYEQRFYDKARKSDGKVIQRDPRKPTAIACDLQLLLVLCMFTVLPPGRNRTICELEVGRTLVQGAIEDGVLVPIENMARPELAQWHLDLSAGDYKTGKIYGQYLTPIDNMKLARGQTFYGLLQTWIDTYRPLFNNPTHNQLFVKVKTTMGATRGDRITHRNMTAWIKYLFYRHVGVPVVPQSLRKMYVTYLKKSGASEAELEAAAKAMGHSRAMQSSQYDEQSLQEKVAPISAFNQQLFNQAFSVQDAAELPLTADGQLRLRDLSATQIKALSQQLRQEQKRRQQGNSAA